MRPTVFLLALFLASCGGGGDNAADHTLTGQWAVSDAVVGTSGTLKLTESNTQVTGSGTYQAEAAQPLTVQVAGTDTSSGVTLQLHFSSGDVQTFSGTFKDADHVDGSLSSSSGTTDSNVHFTRQ